MSDLEGVQGLSDNPIPTILGMEFAYTSDDKVVVTVNYIEPRHQVELATKVTSLQFSTGMAEYLEDAVMEMQINVIRLIDAVNEEMSKAKTPKSIPSRRAAAEEGDTDE